MERGEDHNATSYSTETCISASDLHRSNRSEDHNATSYSTETEPVPEKKMPRRAKIITLRAIALKLSGACSSSLFAGAKIITLRAIALKRPTLCLRAFFRNAKIITLRAIALKPLDSFGLIGMSPGEDHNATSYSTETRRVQGVHRPSSREDHNATSYSTETLQKAGLLEPRLAKIITLRAIALKRSTR